MKTYLVGGYVRDSQLGIRSKDIDIAVEASSYQEMLDYVRTVTSKVFLERPQYLTIRALHDTLGAVDYVMCRKDGAYSDGRHPDQVEPGTIYDDLARRDFTVNAIAIEETSYQIIDPHNGLSDLKSKTLRAVGCTEERIQEDALRIMRALRFQITHNLRPSNALEKVLYPASTASLLASVSYERIVDEMQKMFLIDPWRTIQMLSYEYPHIGGYCFRHHPRANELRFKLSIGPK